MCRQSLSARCDCSCCTYYHNARVVQFHSHPPDHQVFLCAYLALLNGSSLSQYMAGGNLRDALRRDMLDCGSGSQRRLGWYNRGRLVLLNIARGLVFLREKRVRREAPTWWTQYMLGAPAMCMFMTTLMVNALGRGTDAGPGLHLLFKAHVKLVLNDGNAHPGHSQYTQL